MKIKWMSMLAPVVASLLAIIIGAILVGVLGFNPLSVYGSMLSGAFGGWYAIGSTLTMAIPLIFIGLGIALAFKAGLFNIGADGQYWIGAMVTVWLGYHLNGLPGWLHMIVMLLGAMVAGGLWGGIIPGLAKAYRGAHEVITTMMMSYIGILLARYMIEEGPMKAKGFTPQSPMIDQSTWLKVLIPQTQFTTAVILALAAVLVVWFLLYRTTMGYQLRAVGFNQRAAKYAGMNVPLYSILALGLSGVLAGLGGGVQMMATDHRLLDSFASGYGYTGIVVALLARNNPFGVILASIFFAALTTGGGNMQMFSGVPASLTNVLEGLIVFFVAAERLIPMARDWYRTRRTGKHSVAISEKG